MNDLLKTLSSNTNLSSIFHIKIKDRIIKFEYFIYIILLFLVYFTCGKLLGNIIMLCIGFMLVKPEIKKLSIFDSINISNSSIIVILCIILFSIWEVNNIKDPLFEIINKSNSELNYNKLLYTLLFISPFGEEFLYRGFILNLLKKSNIGIITSIIISSLIFTILHMTIVHLIPAFIIGLLFCLVYELTGNIYITIILHIFYNLEALLLITPVPIYIAYMCLAVACVVIYFLYNYKNYLQHKIFVI